MTEANISKIVEFGLALDSQATSWYSQNDIAEFSDFDQLQEEFIQLLHKHRFLSLVDPQRSRSPNHHHLEMPTIITITLRIWLADRGLQGFIKVAEAPPHPNATEIASKLNIETLTDSMVRKKLSLDITGE